MHPRIHNFKVMDKHPLERLFYRLDTTWPEAALALFQPPLAERWLAQLEPQLATSTTIRPLPHFQEETTPEFQPIIRQLQPAYNGWVQSNYTDDLPFICGLNQTSIDGLLLLLGQRRTPASIVDVRAIPPQAHVLLQQAASPYNPFINVCLLYTSPSPRDGATSRMPSSA